MYIFQPIVLNSMNFPVNFSHRFIFYHKKINCWLNFTQWDHLFWRTFQSGFTMLYSLVVVNSLSRYIRWQFTNAPIHRARLTIFWDFYIRSLYLDFHSWKWAQIMFNLLYFSGLLQWCNYTRKLVQCLYSRTSITLD